MLGGLIAARWGWQAAFGVVGVPGLVLALLYLKVRDYRTVELTPALDRVTRSTADAARHIARALVRSRTMLWVCLGGAAQLIVVSAVWSWLPSFLNRVHGIAPAQAAVQAALVVLCGAVGSVFWGAVVDRAGVAPAARQAAGDGAAVRGCDGAAGHRLRRRTWGWRCRPRRSSPDRARRLPDDLHRGPGVGDRDRRDPPGRARHRLLGAGAVPEPVRPGGGALHCRACCPTRSAWNCALAAIAGLRHRGRAGLPAGRAHL